MEDIFYKNKGSQDGWSLVELMIASGITFFILLGISTFFRVVTSNIDRVIDVVEKTKEVEMEIPGKVPIGSILGDLRSAIRVLQINHPQFIEAEVMNFIRNNSSLPPPPRAIITIAAPVRNYSQVIDVDDYTIQGWGYNYSYRVDITHYILLPRIALHYWNTYRNYQNFIVRKGNNILEPAGDVLCRMDSYAINNQGNYNLSQAVVLSKNIYQPRNPNTLLITQPIIQFDAPIVAGPNGRCDTTAQGDDVQIIPPGRNVGNPTTIVILPGNNGVIDTLPAGDDTSCYIAPGSNRIINTTLRGDDVIIRDNTNIPYIFPGQNRILDSWIDSPGNTTLTINDDIIPNIKLVRLNLLVDVDDDYDGKIAEDENNSQISFHRKDIFNGITLNDKIILNLPYYAKVYSLKP